MRGGRSVVAGTRDKNEAATNIHRPILGVPSVVLTWLQAQQTTC
jgi:hypothetical protein